MIDPSGIAFRFLSEYLRQVKAIIETEKISRYRLSQRMGIGPSHVSRLLDPTNNRRIQSLTNMATAVDAKVVPVIYDGPKVAPEVFHACWERAGKPTK